MRLAMLLAASFVSIIDATGIKAQRFQNVDRQEIQKLADWGRKEGACGPYIVFREDVHFPDSSRYTFSLKSHNGRWGMRYEIARSQLDVIIDSHAQAPTAGPVKDNYGAWRYIIWISQQDFAEAPCLRDLGRTKE